ncbi:general transcription repressor, partial [Ascosphaera atra]
MSRLNELLEQVRQEYESQSRNTGEFEHQLTGQLHEMEMIRQKVFQLEQAQVKMKQDYEAEIRALRMELESRGVHLPPSHVGVASAHVGPSAAPPPALSHGSNLFGGLMANPAGQGPALAPPPPPQESQQGALALQQPTAAAAQGPPQSFGPYQSANGTYNYLGLLQPRLSSTTTTPSPSSRHKWRRRWVM